ADIDDHSKFPCYGGNGLRGYTARYTHAGSYALIGRQGALCGNVQSVNGEFFASEHAIVLTPLNETDIHWLAAILKRMNLNQYSESSAQPGLSVSRLLAFSLDVPPFEEQTAIATILSDMDAELAALQTRRDKTHALKQGMMQALLTGRIRLVPTTPQP
ncbi:MAG: restriction endonuclease subunit S, partial [Rhodoferax sp.]|nr:restriction endonuclease subunit S [Rhodoferax sp.]